MSSVRLLAAVALLFAGGACAYFTPGPLAPEQEVTSLLTVPDDKLLVVGRIELRPPFQPDEQVLRTPRRDELKDVLLLYAGSELQDLSTDTVGRPGAFFRTKLDREFFIKIAKTPVLYLSGGAAYALYDPPTPSEFHVLGLYLKTDIRRDDKAVYVGTLQVFRDSKDRVQKVLVRDDYQWANNQFIERFGASRTLRKALVAPVENSPERLQQ
jgi:hypothetical protein